MSLCNQLVTQLQGGEHRCTVDRFKVAQRLRELLPGWTVNQWDDGGGVGHLMVMAPNGWSDTIHGRTEKGRGWHAREAERLVSRVRAESGFTEALEGWDDDPLHLGRRVLR